jgi:hypothetical protein
MRARPHCDSTSERIENIRADARSGQRVAMFFTSPEDARWDAERQAVQFGVEIGEYRGVVRVSRRVFQRLLSEQSTPSAALKPTTYTGPVSSALPSASSASAS